MKKIIEIIFICIFGVSYATITKDIKKEIIYIDPGHGGIDGGCVGNDGTMEKTINLAIALELRDALVNLGYVVELTRVGDYDLAPSQSKNRKRDDIKKRCEIMENSLLYVSIHANSYPGKVRGAQTFYNTPEGKIIAESIQNKIIEMFGNTTRSAHELEDKYILDNINSHGCIVEVGFLSNKEELEFLKNRDYQKNMAYAIALGIIEYLENTSKNP